MHISEDLKISRPTRTINQQILHYHKDTEYLGLLATSLWSPSDNQHQICNDRDASKWPGVPQIKLNHIL